MLSQLQAHDEVAEQYRSVLPASNLIAVAPIALPVFLVRADLLIGAKRSIPSITEFILRSCTAGVNSETAIASFLGLDSRFVSRVICDLSDDDFVSRDSEGNVSLGSRGESVLREMSLWSAEEYTFGFVFDAVLRRPIALRGAELVRPRHVDLSSTVLVHGLPDTRPSTSDLSMADVNTLLRDDPELEAESYELLAVKRVARATRMYRIVTGLLFKSKASRDLNLVIANESDRLSEIEHQLISRDALRVQHLVSGYPDPALDSRLKEFLRSRAPATDAIPDVEVIQQRLAGARFGAQLARGHREANPGPESDLRFAAAEERLMTVQRELDAVPARAMLPYEPLLLLQRAVTEARTRLVITTSTFSDEIVTQAFIDALILAVRNRAEVRVICTSVARAIKLARSGDLGTGRIDAVSRESLGHIQILEGDRSEFFVLACDDRFAAVSNSPWLGFRDDRRSFRPTVGVVMHSGAAIGELRASTLNACRPLNLQRRD